MDKNFCWIFLICVLTLKKFIVTFDNFNIRSAYIGCFQRLIFNNSSGTVSTVDDCVQFCKGRNTNFIALRGSECNCVGGVDSAVPSAHCNSRCSNNEACGGLHLYSVYKDKPRKIHDEIFYLNEEFAEETVAYPPRSCTLEACAHICLERNMSFFEYRHDKCGCFQNFDKKVQIPSNIEYDMCPYNGNEICSIRFLQNSIKFTTRFLYEFQRGYSSYTHCKENIVREIKDNCLEGCSEGWKGDSCRGRDCTRNNGDCGNEMKCIESTVNDYRYVECVCPYGTVRNKWDLCELFQENVALNKKPYASSAWKGNPLIDTIYLNDGVCKGISIARINDSRSAWMSVDLERFYFVGIVKIYGALGTNILSYAGLDKFVVRLSQTFDTDTRTDVRNLLKICGHGPEKAIQAGNPMTVICEDFQLRSRYVILQQSDEKFSRDDFSVAELEVYEVSCDVLNGRCEQMCNLFIQENIHFVRCSIWNDEQTVTNSFYGCYLKVSGDLHFKKAGLSYLQCRDACNSMSKSLAVMQAGFKCYCSSSLNIAGNTSMFNCKAKYYKSNLIFDDCFMFDNFCKEIRSISHSTTITTKINTTDTTETSHSTTIITKINHTDATETLGTIVIINPSNEQHTATTSEETDNYESYKEKLIIAASVSTTTFLLMLAGILGHIIFTRKDQKRVSQTSDMSSVSLDTSGAKSPDDILESVNRQLTEHE
ncbi:hypothetical protein HELRODRAFT_176350 [Helobdella robusta]|uniref:WSC domain-containing protein n=1 Tax=Helobdella robusta TaxID=6412 RepID=T1FAF1_HELRO|nr:hypothetical protein HELRODRAFT_176350 [Helobdella robusta]ESO00042.1 hypothetical protein HELRODRAFT_176350 [Helobdella robusta]